MSHKKRGVTAYLQTFILIAVAMGGSIAVYRAVGVYSSQPTSGLAVSNSSIRQGAAGATLSLTISNTGSSQVQSVTVLDQGISSAVTYCYTLWNPATNSQVAGTCPTMASNPTSIQLNYPLVPGATEVLEVTMPGAVFTPGLTYNIVVVSSSGAASPLGLVAGQG